MVIHDIVIVISQRRILLASAVAIPHHSRFKNPP